MVSGKGRVALLTGGAGFIGSHVAELLTANGWRVEIADNLSRSRQSSLVRLKRAKARMHFCDVRDLAKVRRIFRVTRPQGVVHLAALTSVPESIKRPQEYHEVNVTGTLHVLLAAREAGARSMINISSAAVYGNPTRLPVHEKFDLAPLSPYGATKAAAEVYVDSYTTPQFVGTNLRLFNVYGLGQNPDYAGVISVFLNQVRRSQSLQIFGDGRQTRDFVHVADVASAVLQLLHSPHAGAFNVATGQACTLNSLASMFSKAVSGPLTVQHLPGRPGDIRHSTASIRKLKRLGWKPTVSLRRGIADLLAESS